MDVICRCRLRAEQNNAIAAYNFREQTGLAHDRPDFPAGPDVDFLQRLHLCPLLGAMRTRFARPELFRV
jgi:succinate dehydrogenase/fumarate reductase flavoprotein subunit